jgi:hypothetical protein
VIAMLARLAWAKSSGPQGRGGVRGGPAWNFNYRAPGKDDVLGTVDAVAMRNPFGMNRTIQRAGDT